MNRASRFENIKNKGFASFIVSGGSSPINIFQDLNKSDLDWPNIEVSLVDDRSVDMHHDDSNEKLLNENLNEMYKGGCWGVPTVKLSNMKNGNEFYQWGQDRIHFIEREIISSLNVSHQ